MTGKGHAKTRRASYHGGTGRRYDENARDMAARDAPAVATLICQCDCPCEAVIVDVLAGTVRGDDVCGACNDGNHAPRR